MKRSVLLLLACVLIIVSTMLQQPKEGGVGLKNALERLRLIYGTDFNYRVDRTPSSYKVTLALPLHP